MLCTVKTTCDALQLERRCVHSVPLFQTEVFSSALKA